MFDASSAKVSGVSCIYTDESDVINADSKTISVTAPEDFVAASEKELAVLGKAAYYAPAAARVGDVEFCSFEAAVMTDDGDATVELLKDVTLSVKLTLDKNITIEGNNNTIYGASDSNDIYFEITGANVVVQNVTVKNFGDTAPTNGGIAVFKVPDYRSDSGNEGGSSSGGTTETKYSIKVESAENGKVEASASKAAEGAKVTLTVSSDKGYVLKSLAVLDKDNKEVKLTRVSDGEYNFRMPESAVTVTAVFAEDEGEEEVVFTDVADDAWYYDAVMYAYNNGMMNGVSEGVFAPSMNLTRGMIAQILYNMEEVKVSADTAFSDVAEGQLRGR